MFWVNYVSRFIRLDRRAWSKLLASIAIAVPYGETRRPEDKRSHGSDCGCDHLLHDGLHRHRQSLHTFDGRDGDVFQRGTHRDGADLLYDDALDGPLREASLCGRARHGHQCLSRTRLFWARECLGRWRLGSSSGRAFSFCSSPRRPSASRLPVRFRRD